MIKSGWHVFRQLYRAVCLGLFLGIFQTPGMGQVLNDSIPGLLKIDVEENLGDHIPLDLSFFNTRNKPVQLKDYFTEGVPALVVMAYSDCPMLCSLVLDGLYDGVSQMDRFPGEGYRILTVSIDPEETPGMAKRKQDLYLERFTEKISPESWDFLVGNEPQIKTLADALGFKYYYDEDLKQFAHPAVLFVLTGEGVISRYFFGLEFPSRDLKFALIDASQGKIGSTIEKLILYCFHYDPDARGYVLFAANLMKLGGAVTLAILIIMLATYWMYERKKKNIQ